MEKFLKELFEMSDKVEIGEFTAYMCDILTDIYNELVTQMSKNTGDDLSFIFEPFAKDLIRSLLFTIYFEFTDDKEKAMSYAKDKRNKIIELYKDKKVA